MGPCYKRNSFTKLISKPPIITTYFFFSAKSLHFLFLCYSVTLGFEQPPLRSPGRAGPLHRPPTQTLAPARSPPSNERDHTTPSLWSECRAPLQALWRGGEKTSMLSMEVFKIISRCIHKGLGISFVTDKNYFPFQLAS